MCQLETLTRIAGISGRERQVAAAVVDHVRDHVDHVEMDALGNVIAWSSDQETSLMLEAHLDEVGFMVQTIDEQGRVQLMPTGDIETYLLPGQRLVLHSQGGAHVGVVGFPNRFDGDIDDLLLDLGTNSADELPDIRLGDMVTFAAGVLQLHNGQVCSKALESRAAVLVLLEVARRLKPHRLDKAVAFCFSVGHSTGASGVLAAVNTVKPDEVIVLDATPAGDYPHGVWGRCGSAALGDGPVLWRATNLSEDLFERLHLTANRCNIPSQCGICNRPTPTNADRICQGGHAAAVGLLSIPLRFPHSPSSVVSMFDLVHTTDLLVSYLESR
jgi:endoglucanase